MKTASVVGLLERYEGDIVETQKSLNRRETVEMDETVKLALQAETAANRTKMAQLLSRQKFLKDAVDPVLQMQQARVDKWEERFVDLGSIESIPGMWLVGPELRASLWNQLPDCRFKRAQEEFCKPENYRIPAFDQIDDKFVTFKEAGNLHELPLAAIFVDVDLVSDRLLEHLKLAEFDDDDDQLLRIRKKVTAIPTLKEIYERAEVLSPGNNRILVIRGTDINDPNIDMSVRVIDKDIIGTLLYNRTDEKRKEKGKKMKKTNKRAAQFFPHAFPAHRKTFHQIEGYVMELEKLSDIIVQLQNLNQILNKNWKKDTDPSQKDAMREDALKLFALCDERLRRCKNSYKVDAHDRVEKSEYLLGDEDRKPNVSAVMTCMVSTKDLLNKRFEDMKRKGEANNTDQFVLKTEITQSKRKLDIYHDALLGFAETLSGESTTELPTELPPNMNIQSLDSLRVEPYYTARLLLQDKHELLGAEVASEEYGRAKETSIEMHLVHKFLEVLSTFEDIKLKIIYSGQLSISSIRESVAALREVFSTFQIFPDVIVESYVPVYTEMNTRLTAMEERLRYYETKEMTLQERRELFVRLKEFLDGINILEILKSFRGLGESKQTMNKPK